MANQTLTARSAFTDWRSVATPDLSIISRDNLVLASIAAGKGRLDDVRTIIRDTYGVDLPTKPERVEGNNIAFVWAGPDQWLAVAERGGDGGFGRDLEAELKPLLNGKAAVVDQSDGRAVIRISGVKAREVLAKGLPIDLHPSAFPTNGVAITHASHIGIVIWQIDETPTYEIAMFRSFADSFAHWLYDSTAEFVQR